MKIFTPPLVLFLAGCASQPFDAADDEYKAIDRFASFEESCEGAVRIVRQGNTPARCLKFKCPPGRFDELVCVR